MPEQHPQVQSALSLQFSWQLIASSLAASHHEAQLAMIRKAGVVFQARDLKWSDGNLPRRQIAGGLDSLWLEYRCRDAVHTCHLARGSVDRAEIDGLPKAEVVGIEEA